MKEKHLLTLLSIEAAACVLFCILQRSVSGFFSTIVAFPFEQLGVGLRALSLSGGAGNAAAILFYVLLSLIPAGIWLILKKKQKAMPIDFTLFLLSVLLFVVLYYMINPGLMDFAVPGTGKWSLGSTFYSVLLGYLLIRALLKYRNAGAKKLQEGLWLLLGAVNIVLVYGIFDQELGSLLLNLETVQKGNTGITLSDALRAEYYNRFPGKKAPYCNERRSVSGRERENRREISQILYVDPDRHHRTGRWIQSAAAVFPEAALPDGLCGHGSRIFSGLCACSAAVCQIHPGNAAAEGGQ